MSTKYPIYIPSKGRAFKCNTSKLLDESGYSYKIVVEPDEYDSYLKIYPANNLLRMDKTNQGIAYARTWIKKYSIAQNEEKHWQLDDNIRRFRKWKNNVRNYVLPHEVFPYVERFSNRYVNCGTIGLRSDAFGYKVEKPYKKNKMVYCCILDNNTMDIFWRRMTLGSATDYSIQVCETRKWCTVLFHKYQITKPQMGKQKGGHQNDYAENGREQRIKNLQAIWGPKMIKRKIHKGRVMLNCNHIWRTYSHSLIPTFNINLTLQAEQ